MRDGKIAMAAIAYTNGAARTIPFAAAAEPDGVPVPAQEFVSLLVRHVDFGNTDCPKYAIINP